MIPTSDPQEPEAPRHMEPKEALDHALRDLEYSDGRVSVAVPAWNYVVLLAETAVRSLAAASPDSASPKFAEGWQAAIAAVRVGVGTLHLRSSLLLEDINRVLDALANDGPGRGAASPDSAPAGPATECHGKHVWMRSLRSGGIAGWDDDGPVYAPDQVLGRKCLSCGVERATPASTTGPGPLPKTPAHEAGK